MKRMYTKGEWTVGNMSKNKFDVNEISIDCSDAGVTNLAQVFGNDNELEEAKSNAKLIASAPDLLEALLKLVYEHNGEYYTGYHGCANVTTIVKNAIKKATE